MGKTSKDKRDIYYRLAKEQGWRARSAFKLLHIEETFHILQGVTRVVDLCAAPGSWSQVLSQHIYEPCPEDQRDQVKIVAVDLQGMAPINGVQQLRADITKESTANDIISFMGGRGKAQLVISDGAPDATGMHDIDEYMQGQLLLSALSIATYVLETDGSFVAKIFRADNTRQIYSQLQRFFQDVCVFKPGAARNSSIEAFVVCRKFTMPIAFVPCNLSMDWLNQPEEAIKEIKQETNEIPVRSVPFVAYKDILDADCSYQLDDSYRYCDVVQEPLTAAYQELLAKTKNVSIKYKPIIVRHEQQLNEN